MSFALVLGVADKVNSPVPDTFTNAGTLVCPETVRLNFTIFNQGVYLRILRTTPGGGTDDTATDAYYGPGWYSLDRACGKVQVRNAVPGQAAAFACEALTANNLPR